MAHINDPTAPTQVELLQYVLESNEAILVQLMRLYDVQMTILASTSPEQAETLENLHEAGRVLSSMPFLEIGPTDLEIPEEAGTNE